MGEKAGDPGVTWSGSEPARPMWLSGSTWFSLGPLTQSFRVFMFISFSIFIFLLDLHITPVWSSYILLAPFAGISGFISFVAHHHYKIHIIWFYHDFIFVFIKRIILSKRM